MLNVVNHSKFDSDAISAHFQHMHHAAARANVQGGKLVLAVFGEDPDTKETFANVQHFEIGDHEGMTAAALAFAGVPHANSYAPYVVLKPEALPGTRKGEDIAVVLALVNDADADKGTAAPALPDGVLPDYVIESSTGNFQQVLWLDRPLSPAEAKTYGNALKRATGADAANDIGHVWRVPGTLNWPNAKKVHERGRPREPQPVRVQRHWDKWTSVSDLRAALEPHWQAPRPERTTASPDVPQFDYDRVARWLGRKIEKWQDDPTALSQADWALLGKALKLSFPNEDGLALWLRVSHDKATAEKRWNNPRDFDPEYVEGMRTLHWYTDRDTDWMFGDVVEQLKNGTYLAPAFEPRSDLPPPPMPSTEPVEADYYDAPALRVISAASFAGKPAPEREELVRGLIPAKIIGGLYGDGAVGKSLLAMMLGVAVAIGRPWLNRIVQKGPVVYVCCEDDEAEVHRRLENICREMGVDMATLGDFHIVPLADEDSVLASSDGRSNVLTATPLYSQLVELAKDVRPQLLIGDTLNDIFAGSENDRMQAKQFVKLMRPLVIPHGGTGLILAHPSVDGMRSGRGTSGTTGWNNSFRWRGYLDKVLDEQGNEPDPTRRVLRTKKLNYGPQGGEIELRYQNGCYALGWQESMADPLAKAARADRVFVELLRKHIAQNNHVSVHQKGAIYAPTVFAAEAGKQGVSRAELKEAMQRLLDSNKIENAPFGAASRKQYRLYVNP